MLILSLIVLQVLPVSFCYDVELQGKVKVANKIIGALRQPTEFINLLLSYLPPNIMGKGKLPKALETLAMPYLRTRNNTVQTDNNTTEIDNNTTETDNNQITDPPKKLEISTLQLEECMNHLQETGKTNIRNLSAQIVAELDIKRNITPIIRIVTTDYINTLKNYYEYLEKNKKDADIDLLYLDMVETSCRLLFDEEKKLLNDIIMHENDNDHHGRFKKLSRELLKRNYMYKRAMMRHVCDTYKVCKEYPAVSDYGAEIISEVLMLNDKKFITILQIMSKIFRQNEKHILRIMDKEDRNLISAKLKHFTTDLFATKEFLALARAVITQRFKPVSRGSEEFKMKIKATRMLLDIFDKALNVEDDVIGIDSDNCVQAIKNWATDKRDDIEDILNDFVKNLIIRLQHNLTKTARTEIKYLITAIMRGSTADIENLLKSGSKYVKGNDFHPDVDILTY